MATIVRPHSTESPSSSTSFHVLSHRVPHHRLTADAISSALTSSSASAVALGARIFTTHFQNILQRKCENKRGGGAEEAETEMPPLFYNEEVQKRLGTTAAYRWREVDATTATSARSVDNSVVRMVGQRVILYCTVVAHKVAHKVGRISQSFSP